MLKEVNERIGWDGRGRKPSGYYVELLEEFLKSGKPLLILEGDTKNDVLGARVAMANAIIRKGWGNQVRLRVQGLNLMIQRITEKGEAECG